MTTFGYDTDNRRESTTFANGVLEDVDYDRAGRPTMVKATLGANVLTHFGYDYTTLNGSGQPTERSLRSKMEDHRRGTTTRYLYDAMNRLYSATTTGSVSDTWEYRYDNASNRTKAIHDGNVTTFAYENDNEFCWRVDADVAPDCSTSPSGRVTYDYDRNGSLTSSSAGLAIAYNALGQTTSFDQAGVPQTTFAYAGEGQQERTRKNGISFLDSVLGLSSEVTGGGAAVRYLRDAQGTLLGMRRGPAGGGAERLYYLRDALGSVVALTDATGAVRKRHVYEDPYGEQVTTDDIGGTAISNPYRFAGEYLDSETGLYKIGARYYAPTQGRWTQKDPLNQAFSPREGNGYGYVGGDPVNLVDPTGTFSISAQVDIGIPGTSASIGLSAEIDDDGDMSGSVGGGGGAGSSGAIMVTPGGEAAPGSGISGGGCIAPRGVGPGLCYSQTPDGPSFGIGAGSQANIQYEFEFGF